MHTNIFKAYTGINGRCLSYLELSSSVINYNGYVEPFAILCLIYESILVCATDLSQFLYVSLLLCCVFKQ